MKRIFVGIVLLITVFVSVFTFLEGQNTSKSLKFFENVNTIDTAKITFDGNEEVINYSDRDKINSLFNKLDISTTFSAKYNREIEGNILKLYCTVEAFCQNEMISSIEIYQVKNEVFIIGLDKKISSSIDEIECVVKINKKFWELKNNKIILENEVESCQRRM